MLICWIRVKKPGKGDFPVICINFNRISINNKSQPQPVILWNNLCLATHETQLLSVGIVNHFFASYIKHNFLCVANCDFRYHFKYVTIDLLQWIFKRFYLRSEERRVGKECRSRWS